MVEIAIGMIVILILYAVATSGTKNALSTGQITKATTETASLCAAVSQYKYEIGSYPASLSVLTSANDVYGPWLTSVPSSDPWGNAYHYYYGNTSFAIWSNGPNGVNNSGTAVPSAFSNDDIGFISK